MTQDELSLSLSAMRDVLKMFGSMATELNTITQKHGVPLNEILQNSTLSRSPLDALTSMPNDKLGMLVKILGEFQGLQDGMKNFMSYNPTQLQDFTNRLDSLVRQFDDVLDS